MNNRAEFSRESQAWGELCPDAGQRNSLGACPRWNFWVIHRLPCLCGYTIGYCPSIWSWLGSSAGACSIECGLTVWIAPSGYGLGPAGTISKSC